MKAGSAAYSFFFTLFFSLVKKRLELRKSNVELMRDLSTVFGLSKILSFSFSLFLGFAFSSLTQLYAPMCE